MSLIDLAASNPVLTLATAVVSALLLFAGKWWTGLFGYQGKFAENSHKAATSALQMQEKAMERMSKELERSRGQFKDDLKNIEASLRREMALHQKTFESLVKRMENKEERLVQEIKQLTDRITRYEAQEQEFKKQINLWKERYEILNNEKIHLVAQLEVHRGAAK